MIYRGFFMPLIDDNILFPTPRNEELAALQ